MRVPVLPSDLPEKFNKVAKYIGRHWPQEKQGLNKSREALAYLLGYNSVHEVNKVSDSNTLPGTIELSKVYSSMVVKALYKYGLRPDVFKPILYKTPFKEMAFYSVTDEEQERARLEKLNSATGKMFLYDESHDFLNYTSPKLIVEQHKQDLIPSYDYAVNKSQKIFCSSTYESLLNTLGDIEELVDKLDAELSLQEFTEKYILPLAWLPIDDFLVKEHMSKHARWKTPNMISVEHIRQGDNVLGYVFHHHGYNAYFPIICSTVEEANKVLSSLYIGDLVEPKDSLDGTYELSMSSVPTLSDSGYEHWIEKDFQKSQRLFIDGQLLLRPEVLKPYIQKETNKVLKNLKWETIDDLKIPSEAIDDEVYKGHLTIKRSRKAIVKTAETSLRNVSAETIKKVIQYLFSGNKIELNNLIAADYESYEIEEDELSRWKHIGTDVISFHTELTDAFSIEALGYLYCDYENYVNGQRYTYSCEERSLSFIAYVMSVSSKLPTSRVTSKDCVFAGIVLLEAYSVTDSTYELNNLIGDYQEITSMLTQHYEQDGSISNIKKYSNFVKRQDPNYLTHGEKASYSERSAKEGMFDAYKKSRSINTKYTYVKQDISDFKS